ncbi:EAL domain-containing protein [Serpentinicella alkaliphila]|uniref:EAL domain-containing protein (Putative c-di-GMP-specific phosphodiesterase class I) n=1 Tax=Serpentinicella alkaliphila TaxID=1734049 RepID=A0A4R2T6H2_9FIRM|nr:EAL domain-containing protein [Serpentinicella alkaliphila]QUH26534.1 EAL domain-containing protein [Serpentinicella alkaliphila]TCP96464.1 EAL domain-containing protein (putative c-di-GMP-specific phosphodiesterase class I) [Serpentinicella alkaliphila]
MTESNEYLEGSINILLISSAIDVRREISNILLKTYDNTLITNNIIDGLKILKEHINSLNIIVLNIPADEKEDYFNLITMIKDLRHDLEIYAIINEIDLSSIITLANSGISKLMTGRFNSIKFINDLKEISSRIARHQIFGKYINIYEDTTTKLPNKLKLSKDINLNEDYYLIIINVDGFRQINDCFGVEAGDFISLEVSKILSRYVINKFFRLYKIQIDEYALLITNKYNRIDYNKLVTRIVNDLTNNPFIYDNREIYYNVSAGIATSQYGNKDLIRNAGLALTVTKTNKSIYTMYDESIETHKNTESIFWLNELKKAITNDYVVLYFQPIVSNTSGKIEYLEALIRIKKEDGTLYFPNEFINISKQIRLYNQLTKIVLTKAINVAKTYNCNISINLSFEDIINEDTREFILNALTDENINKRIKFELTESESITNYELISSFINDINERGSMIAIDDFGSGYSNYYNILRLNINYLKLDGSLIRNILTDSYGQAIIKSVVELTKQLNIKTIAEYVYSEEVHQYVKELKIDYSQGYHISYPLTEDELINYLEKNKGLY